MTTRSKIVIHHDDDAMNIIDMFSKTLKQFGVFVVNVSEENGDTIDIILTNDLKTEDKLWKW